MHVYFPYKFTIKDTYVRIAYIHAHAHASVYVHTWSNTFIVDSNLLGSLSVRLEFARNVLLLFAIAIARLYCVKSK